MNNNCKELSIRLLCQITTRGDVNCVIFCSKLETHVGKDICQLSFYKTNTKDLETCFFFAQGINFYVYCILFRDPIVLTVKFKGLNSLQCKMCSEHYKLTIMLLIRKRQTFRSTQQLLLYSKVSKGYLSSRMSPGGCRQFSCQY